MKRKAGQNRSIENKGGILTKEEESMKRSLSYLRRSSVLASVVVAIALVASTALTGCSGSGGSPAVEEPTEGVEALSGDVAVEQEPVTDASAQYEEMLKKSMEEIDTLRAAHEQQLADINAKLEAAKKASDEALADAKAEADLEVKKLIDEQEKLMQWIEELNLLDDKLDTKVAENAVLSKELELAKINYGWGRTEYIGKVEKKDPCDYSDGITPEAMKACTAEAERKMCKASGGVFGCPEELSDIDKAVRLQDWMVSHAKTTIKSAEDVLNDNESVIEARELVLNKSDGAYHMSALADMATEVTGKTVENAEALIDDNPEDMTCHEDRLADLRERDFNTNVAAFNSKINAFDADNSRMKIEIEVLANAKFPGGNDTDLSGLLNSVTNSSNSAKQFSLEATTLADFQTNPPDECTGDLVIAGKPTTASDGSGTVDIYTTTSDGSETAQAVAKMDAKALAKAHETIKNAD